MNKLKVENGKNIILHKITAELENEKPDLSCLQDHADKWNILNDHSDKRKSDSVKKSEFRKMLGKRERSIAKHLVAACTVLLCVGLYFVVSQSQWLDDNNDLKAFGMQSPGKTAGHNKRKAPSFTGDKMDVRKGKNTDKQSIKNREYASEIFWKDQRVLYALVEFDTKNNMRLNYLPEKMKIIHFRAHQINGKRQADLMCKGRKTFFDYSLVETGDKLKVEEEKDQLLLAGQKHYINEMGIVFYVSGHEKESTATFYFGSIKATLKTNCGQKEFMKMLSNIF